MSVPAQQIPMAYPVTAQPQVVQVFTNSNPLASQWTSDVMDCFKDIPVCLCGTFLTPCLACRVASDFGECCCLPAVGGAVLALRTGIRERHHIPGTICNDCVCLTFCGPCTLCQMARELKARK
ncbi:cornifelin homolog isoform X2 [Hyla sarda]|uniref:cornifelin homolog isoform X2 n=1 Tax=Hyla sarda TaxID=327740 RepID=UPI0024C4134C|nr:cornifelin homolog isoform X2 [Hyla sarda]